MRDTETSVTTTREEQHWRSPTLSVPSKLPASGLTFCMGSQRGSGLARSPRPGRAGEREFCLGHLPYTQAARQACPGGVPSASTAHDSPSSTSTFHMQRQRASREAGMPPRTMLGRLAGFRAAGSPGVSPASESQMHRQAAGGRRQGRACPAGRTISRGYSPSRGPRRPPKGADTPRAEGKGCIPDREPHGKGSNARKRIPAGQKIGSRGRWGNGGGDRTLKTQDTGAADHPSRVYFGCGCGAAHRSAEDSEGSANVSLRSLCTPHVSVGLGQPPPLPTPPRPELVLTAGPRLSRQGPHGFPTSADTPNPVFGPHNLGTGSGARSTHLPGTAFHGAGGPTAGWLWGKWERRGLVLRFPRTGDVRGPPGRRAPTSCVHSLQGWGLSRAGRGSPCPLATSKSPTAEREGERGPHKSSPSSRGELWPVSNPGRHCVSVWPWLTGDPQPPHLIRISPYAKGRSGRTWISRLGRRSC